MPRQRTLKTHPLENKATVDRITKAFKKTLPKYSYDQLVEHCNVETTIICSKCGQIAMDMFEEFMASDNFFKEGWRATKSNCYCPACAIKNLKNV